MVGGLRWEEDPEPEDMLDRKPGRREKREKNADRAEPVEGEVTEAANGELPNKAAVTVACDRDTP